MQVGDDQLQGGALPGWYSTDLLETSIAAKHLLYSNPVKISTNVEVDFVVVFCPNCMDCVYNMFNCAFFELALW